ncbi:MAG: NADH-quinone oxidoreductase subunit L, partial [Cytophagales bacterium]|nr:NADH-quinone oxidoreductase subunit L [Cytophagales bacterium]
FLISLSLYLAKPNGEAINTTIDLFRFIHVGTLNIPFSFLIDPLSITMLLIVTGIGFLIHIYSIGYMHDDESFPRFFAYLNLFVFFMLILVLGSNYVITFIGWEGVGLCSYLLIGFWFKNPDYNDAAKKAFIMNRIGDLGFLLAVFLIFLQFGTVIYPEIAQKATNFYMGDATITVITLLLFFAATGKSAQIPLYTWLPDAMAGPTPVSALIHAATMVTAGIYMIIRSNALFIIAPFTNDIIVGIGLATALFAASIGLVQNDIKKVLAYSTVSQLGYMFLALGLGAYSAALFHVITHAFFKALLFLGAGSVIHAVSGEQDIRNMGGLKKALPITFFTFLIGTIAIAGIPPFSGFFSKDAILAAAFEKSPVLWGLGVLGALMTAFYMFRLLFLTFFGKFRGTHEQEHHLHESPLTMTLPLIVLAVLSIGGGIINLPHIFGGHEGLGVYLEPLMRKYGEEAHHLEVSTEYMLMAVSVGLVLVSIIVAYVIYVSKKSVPSPDGDSKESFFHKLLYNKYYVDELYTALVQKPIDMISSFLYNIIEKLGIDNLVNGTGTLVQRISGGLRLVQTGYIGFYVFAMALGIIALLIFNFIR